jgi:hypothetical protein
MAVSLKYSLEIKNPRLHKLQSRADGASCIVSVYQKSNKCQDAANPGAESKQTDFILRPEACVCSRVLRFDSQPEI